MKLGEIARYWAAKELTRIEHKEGALTFRAPFACPQFTVKLLAPEAKGFALTAGKVRTELKEVAKLSELKNGTWLKEKDSVTVCFDLPKGLSAVG